MNSKEPAEVRRLFFHVRARRSRLNAGLSVFVILVVILWRAGPRALSAAPGRRVSAGRARERF